MDTLCLGSSLLTPRDTRADRLPLDGRRWLMQCPIALSDFKRIVALGLSEATAHQLTNRILRTQA